MGFLVGCGNVAQSALYCPASTVSFKPIAFVTATSVDKRGLPCADSARYRLSRSIPAALATLATPPRASATRRKATRSTRGSSASSSAALKYSAATAEPINGHAAQMKAWQRVVRCRNSLSSKSLRKISVGTPSALLQVAVAHKRGNGEIRGHVRELFRWWSRKSEK